MKHILECTLKVLETLSKVMDTNPDHLEAQGVEHMYNLLSSPEVRNSVLFGSYFIVRGDNLLSKRI